MVYAVLIFIIFYINSCDTDIITNLLKMYKLKLIDNLRIINN